MIPVFWKKGNRRFTKDHWRDPGKNHTLCGLPIPGSPFETREGEIHSGQICARCHRIVRIRYYKNGHNKKKR